ncbi:hypothetical protein bcere0007_21250 [Bacillus mycoides]|nr:hypothetical protein bcere0007_21250 [Bacillus mycoides]
MIKKPTGDLKDKFRRTMKLIKEIEGKLRLTYKKKGDLIRLSFLYANQV